MNVNNVFLETLAVKKDGFPQSGLPEIALAGRSNAGKSSLINAMINRKALARTSSAPGKTRTVNFYNIENKLYFVDLPGYGYAKASKSEKEKLGQIIEEYLLDKKTKRENIAGVVLFIDMRHELMEIDKIMYDFLNYYGFDIIIILAKADKLKKSDFMKKKSYFIKELNHKGAIIPFSSVTKMGKDELWNEIEKRIDQTNA